MAEISAKAVKSLREQTGAGMMDCKRALSEAQGDVEKAIEVLRERGLAKAGKREGRATSEGVIAIALEGRRSGMVELGCETDFVARTEDFTGLAEALARIAARDAAVTTPQALLDASIAAEKVSERITAAIAKLGENVVVKRVARLEVEGEGVIGGYVHAGAKLGVLVSLAAQNPGAEVEALAKDLAMHVAAADPTPVAVTRDGVSQAFLAKEREIFRKQALQEGKPEKVVDRIVEGKINKVVAEICLVEQAFVKDPDKSVGDLLKQAGEVRVVAFERFKLGQAEEEPQA
ncbi:MAG: translation elongation factor Ts [Myxococcales bacterium]|nr:translation elongation factor Ts [Myxococcales bacterium]MDH5566331.1 translation elongation factor Ts [Myxococcales bacterium]